ncbi:hypothetical protein [Pedobacter panaciterrae]
MILKNPITGIALSESELSYFVKLKLDASWITEDWIANNVPIEEIEQFVVLHLNETKRSHRFFKNSKYKKKLKKYLVVYYADSRHSIPGQTVHPNFCL